MATKRASKKTVAKKSPAKAKRASATKGGKTRGSRAKAQVKDAAMRVLAGATAGAVRAMMPPLEKIASSQEAAAKTTKK